MSLAKYRKVSKGNGEYQNPTPIVNSSEETTIEKQTQEEDNGI